MQNQNKTRLGNKKVRIEKRTYPHRNDYLSGALRYICPFCNKTGVDRGMNYDVYLRMEECSEKLSFSCEHCGKQIDLNYDWEQ